MDSEIILLSSDDDGNVELPDPKLTREPKIEYLSTPKLFEPTDYNDIDFLPDPFLRYPIVTPNLATGLSSSDVFDDLSESGDEGTVKEAIKEEDSPEHDRYTIDIDSSSDNENKENVIQGIQENASQPSPQNSNIRNEIDIDTAESILKIILQNPKEYESTERPIGRQDVFFSTLDNTKIPFNLTRADDNGAYQSRGTTKKFYSLQDGIWRIVRVRDDGVFIYNKRIPGYKDYKRIPVKDNHVYEIIRYYRYNHVNKFINLIITVRLCTSDEIERYYIFANKPMVIDGEVQNSEDIIVPRHGNAKNPHAAPYFKKDRETYANIDQHLNEGKSVDEIYVNWEELGPGMGSHLTNPKIIHNRKYNHKLRSDEASRKTEIEGKALISLARSGRFVRTVNFSESSYTSFNCSDYMLNQLEKYCVQGNSILSIDTTFQTADGLWLTDTSYENESLVDKNGKHPHFPGPSMWHFQKSEGIFRRFATELVHAKETLRAIKKIGHDMDLATVKGFSSVFDKPENVWCTQHFQERDSFKLTQLGANQRTKQHIMTDIYGSQVGNFVVFGLADAEDEIDLRSKFKSVAGIWDESVPGFSDYFRKQRLDKFIACLTIEARENLGLSGRYYNNALELMHKLQKKKLKEMEVKRDVRSVSEALEEWNKNYFTEHLKAVYGQGKYRLAPGYDKFQRNPVIFNRLSDENKKKHMDAFLEYTPDVLESYQKPDGAGLKKKRGQKRRARLPEASLFDDRLSQETSVGLNATPRVTPLKLRKRSSANPMGEWDVEKIDSEDDIFNPNRSMLKMYKLVHRKEKKEFPDSVKRCEDCRFAFNSSDVIAVKTRSLRSFTDKKTGKLKTHAGNVYLHYLTKCLKSFEQNFQMKNIRVSVNTQSHLTKFEVEKLRKHGCTIE